MTQQIFVFPGQGSQYSGMGKEWFSNFAQAREAYEEASDALGMDIAKLCFEGSDEELAQTANTQPALLTTSVAIYRSLEIDKNAVFAGHSLGEYSALVAAGALSLGSAAKLVRKRGELMQSAVPQGQGGMLALLFKPGSNGESIADELCQGVSQSGTAYVAVANYNTPEQIVVSGDSAGIEALKTKIEESELPIRKVLPLNVSAPFHCQLMKPAAEGLAGDLLNAEWTVSSAEYFANVSAEKYTLGEGTHKETAQRLIEQIDHSVRWSQTMRNAIEQGYTQLTEVGPGQVLFGMARRFKVNEQGFNANKIDRIEDYKKLRNG